MGLTNENLGTKILAKIKIYVLTRGELLFHVCYEIPCKFPSFADFFFRMLHLKLGKSHYLLQASYKRFYAKRKVGRKFEVDNKCTNVENSNFNLNYFRYIL